MAPAQTRQPGTRQPRTRPQAPRRFAPRQPALALLAALLGAVCGLALAGCGSETFGELRNIQADRHSIANPGKIHASATGLGCGLTQHEALTTAKRVAQFNLRSLTGEGRYNLRFNVLNETENPQGVCVEVTALAVEPLPYAR
jgi:hypothetical protein